MSHLLQFSVLLWFSFVYSNNVSFSNDIPPERKARKLILKEAKDLIGSPYKYGGINKNGFDCSGLIFKIYKKYCHRELPRSSYQFQKFGEKIKKKHALPGDLVLFKKRGKIFHVSIIESIQRNGDINVIHCTSSSGVVENNISNSAYWKSKIEGYYRIIGN